MGLYLLNISVDTADPYPDYIPEDLSFNDQESIVEILLEQVLGYENAIAEYDDHDSSGHSKGKTAKLDLKAQWFAPGLATLPGQQGAARSCPRDERLPNSRFREAISPPPRPLICL
ncbi:hypothetical protein [Phaeodactylibacter luteus]|uniref:Uncharacterized protein n=1 Tax=Phaeodactylibacter luteus TaxID=1564516 RepID=A0A5C6S495_9BACT|nr:hypothetical protein [Phaeodactylibacter luteus]TXB68372.1 hypothetical protein FRY97_03050 [Phaeodactylibacter luteus]